MAACGVAEQGGAGGREFRGIVGGYEHARGAQSFRDGAHVDADDGAAGEHGFDEAVRGFAGARVVDDHLAGGVGAARVGAGVDANGGGEAGLFDVRAQAGTFGYMLGPLNRTVGLGTARQTQLSVRFVF